MLRLLLLAAGAYWLRKPENRKLAAEKLKEGWHRVVHPDDERSSGMSQYSASRRPNDEREV